jgi:hypothetical protein
VGPYLNENVGWKEHVMMIFYNKQAEHSPLIIVRGKSVV